MDPAIITSATTALVATVATKSFEAPIKSLNDLWDGALGHHIAAWSEKRKLKAFQNIEGFKQDLADEINKIPNENLQEPKTSIVGPTFESSKYYMEEEDLRLMFAKVVASSMDSGKNGYVQHSFVEIIKQLSSLDAQILKSINKTSPIVNISMESVDSSGGQMIYSDLFINPKFHDNSLNSISVNNLKRLGLINIEYDKYYVDKDIYIPFKNSQEYKEVEKRCEHSTEEGIKKTPEIGEGIVTITNFGFAFKNICID